MKGIRLGRIVAYFTWVYTYVLEVYLTIDNQICVLKGNIIYWMIRSILLAILDMVLYLVVIEERE